MASAYTPGLTVSNDLVVRRTRRLPIKGEVLVRIGDKVDPEQPVARALLPGPLQTIKLAEKMGIEAREARAHFQLKEGDSVQQGQIVAETKGFLGMFKTSVASDYSGVIETISEITGNVLVREASIPVEIKAYVEGVVADVIPDEGAIIETRGAMIQGIFGVGGERMGVIRKAVSGPGDLLEEQHILDSDAGKVLIGGSGVTLAALRKAIKVGVNGVVAGGIKDSDLIGLLGYDIGVAITGQEAIDVTVIVTEGFGHLAMARRTFELLSALEGYRASVNGATQIRAGVIRPELIIPKPAESESLRTASSGGELTVGTPIRVIREPYFGALGKVIDLPSTLQVLESGTEVRVLRAELESGENVTVPRANVEIIAT